MSIRKIALTGGIASGKSLAGTYLQQHGVPVIDADEVVHALLRDDPELKSKIRGQFGDDVFTPEGQVDRQKLGSKVFNDQGRRKLLESWIHPKVRDAIEQFFQDNLLKKIGVALIPLLFESNLEKHYDEVWLLDIDEATQTQRLVDKRGMTPEAARARIASQMSAGEKRRRAQAFPQHHILDNRGTPDDLFRQLAKILSGLGLP